MYVWMSKFQQWHQVSWMFDHPREGLLSSFFFSMILDCFVVFWAVSLISVKPEENDLAHFNSKPLPSVIAHSKSNVCTVCVCASVYLKLHEGVNASTTWYTRNEITGIPRWLTDERWHDFRCAFKIYSTCRVNEWYNTLYYIEIYTWARIRSLVSRHKMSGLKGG